MTDDITRIHPKPRLVASDNLRDATPDALHVFGFGAIPHGKVGQYADKAKLQELAWHIREANRLASEILGDGGAA